MTAARDRMELEASIDRLLIDSRRAELISRRANELRGDALPEGTPAETRVLSGEPNRRDGQASR